MIKKSIEPILALEHHRRKVQSKNDMLIFIVLFVFIASCLLFLSLPNVKVQPLHSIYIEMSIFLFAMIAGFTVSRLNNRYREIIKQITTFDGGISTMYREFAHFGQEYQDKFEEIARKHYMPIIEFHKWDYNIINKSTTLSSTYTLVKEALEDTRIANIEHSAVSIIKKALAEMQISRKDMIALHAERMPQFQLFVIYFLAFILILTISSVTSHGQMVESILKGAFVTAIVATGILVQRMDTLDLFESFLGEHSAQDILDIFEGKK